MVLGHELGDHSQPMTSTGLSDPPFPLSCHKTYILLDKLSVLGPGTAISTGSSGSPGYHHEQIANISLISQATHAPYEQVSMLVTFGRAWVPLILKFYLNIFDGDSEATSTHSATILYAALSILEPDNFERSFSLHSFSNDDLVGLRRVSTVREIYTAPSSALWMNQTLVQPGRGVFLGALQGRALIVAKRLDASRRPAGLDEVGPPPYGVGRRYTAL